MARYPVGYGTARVSFDELKRRYSGELEPEYARRLFAWLKSKDGAIGIGSAWRPNASNVSQASRLGRSFHQTQTFADGTKHCCAVDLVVPTAGKHTSGGVPTGLVPIQGSTEARQWGVHINIGTPGKPGFESWHMQPIEIDGWATWANAGRKRPIRGYDLPVDASVITPPPSIDDSVSPFAPEFSEYGLYPLDARKAVVHRDSRPRPHDLVRYLQGRDRLLVRVAAQVPGTIHPARSCATGDPGHDVTIGCSGNVGWDAAAHKTIAIYESLL